MTAGALARILTLNSGSSSLKFSLYRMSSSSEALELSGHLSRIGIEGGNFRASHGGEPLAEQDLPLPDHAAALGFLFDWLRKRTKDPEAVGHRVVQGGIHHRRPAVVDDELLATLHELTPLAPDHLPHEIEAIEAVSRVFPTLKQVACFDTSFHRAMPRLAQLYPLPRYLEDRGLIRYGFHGLSYESIVAKLSRDGHLPDSNRLLVAHLGNGASIAAIHAGRSIDTTMGLTPAGGLVMGTRTGDLDPGVLLFLLQQEGWSPSALNRLINKHAGLLGISELTSDMSDLLAKETENPRAAEAVSAFCYSAKKWIGALAAALGGLDALVFTGGIGENAPQIRQRVCAGLGFLGIELDPRGNEASAPVISAPGAKVTVRVMKTDEELTIARHVFAVIRERSETS
jgi:acetate kinase